MRAASPLNIGQIAIPVKDLERATTFYRDTLGLALLFTVPGMSFFDCGGVRLMLSRPESEPSGNSILYYRVSDIARSFEVLRRHVAVEREPHRIAPMPTHDLWMAFLRDSEGNLFALMSEVERAER